MDLLNSKRTLTTASYVVVQLTPEERQRLERSEGRGFDKLNFVRQIGLSLSDVRRASGALLGAHAPETMDPHTTRDALARLEELVTHIQSQERSRANLELVSLAARLPVPLLLHIANHFVADTGSVPLGVQVQFFELRMRTAPVGRLHLERIEMYPAGVQRGELMFTVPLAPKESATISHKEWSISTQEYERIVQDYFESYSERGVAEKTDISISIENESKRASAFNFSSSVSGGFGPVSTSLAIGLSQTSDNREAIKQTAQRAREITEKASARARQEHKVSAKLETEQGVEDSSYRTIQNPSDTQAMRIDYYRMMRKWRTDLYRYGLRLTFDMAIPIPGARLWSLYRRVRALDSEIAAPFVFSLKPDDITEANWQQKAGEYGAALDAPPDAYIPLTQAKTLSAPQGGNEMFTFVPPENYLLDMEVKGEVMWHGPGGAMPPIMLPPNTLVNDTAPVGTLGGGGSFEFSGPASGSSRQATFTIIFASTTLLATLRMGARPSQAFFDNWQTRSWAALRDAAFTAHQQRIARLQAERDQLWMALTNKDTLTLRRLEREELIREALHWLIGPDFDPTPWNAENVVNKIIDLQASPYGVWGPFGQVTKLTAQEWATAAGFGDFVKFIHQAVEWENLLYFLYPYFWGSETLARERMLFEHPDPMHREFLRAGYARVVVPVRPGFEQSFTELLDSGIFSGPGNSPYMTIADEIAAFAKTNYAGIPPANPEKHARPLLYPEQRKTWETMEKVVRMLDTHLAENGKYPATLSELAGAPFKDAWNRDLVYRNPGSGNDYDLLSLGEDGEEGGEGLDADISAAASASLVASWFDYTPTSGIDIELNTPPASIV